jgi:chromosome segregation ATPase
MDESVKSSLQSLHEKQDQQTEKLTKLEIDLATQKTILDIYSKDQSATALELSKINQRLLEYNHELKLHIAGVNELKLQNSLIREELKQRDIEIQMRLGQAEKPIEWIQQTGTVVKWVAGLLTAVAAIYAALKGFGMM